MPRVNFRCTVHDYFQNMAHYFMQHTDTTITTGITMDSTSGTGIQRMDTATTTTAIQITDTV